MNIHLPAILMFTRGTRFWHTAIFILVIQIFPMSGLSQPEAPDLGCQVARSNDSTNQRRGHEVYKTGDPGGGASSLEVAWSIFLWIHQEKGALARKITPEPSWNQIFLSSAKTLCVACGVLGYEGTCASGVVLWTWPPFFGVLDFAGPMQHCSVLFYLLFLFFPTSLCGVLVFDSVSLPLRRLPLLRPLLLFVNHHLSHTISHTHLCQPPSFTHTQLCHTHAQLCHTHNFVTHHLSHTQLCHTQLCHTHSFVTHTTLSTTIFHTQLCQPPSFTHHLSHTTLTHTHNFVTHTDTQLCHTPSFTHNFVTHHLSHTTLRGRRGTYGKFVALGEIDLGFAWKAWYKLHLVARLVAVGRPGAAALCVAGGALGDTHLRFTWQAWHLATSTFVLRGRGGTSSTWWRAWSPLVARALCVAGVALGDIHLGFTWQAWHLATGVALGDIHLRFTWQAWHLATSTCVWRGRRGRSCTWWRAWSPLVARGAAALCVAGVALGDIHLRFTWQAWHLATSTCVWRGRCGRSCTWWRAWSPLVARGGAALCVAGVAQGDIHLGFTWQAWHLAASTFVLRGRWRAWSPLVARGAAALCMAGVAQGDIHLGFTWQVLHLATSTFVLRGRRGRSCSWWHAWSPLVARGAAALCVAGVAQSDIFLSSNELLVLCSHSCKWHALMSLHGILGPCTLFFCSCASFTHRFVTHHFHTQLSHTRSFTQNFVTHIIFFVAHHLSYTNLSRTTLHIQLVLRLDPPPPPLSFLPSPSPLQHLVLIIGRRWLVGLSGLTMS